MQNQTITTRGKKQKYCGEGRQERGRQERGRREGGQFILHEHGTV